MISPTPPLATSRRLGALMMVAVAITLAGCAPTPAPTPTPTAAFASEEEAFAAAEATYRAYTDALNAVEPANPDTFDDTYAFSSGGVQRADRENFSTMHAEGYSISGDAVVTRFVGQAAREALEVVEAIICVDVSGVTVVDATGTSVVNSDRPDMYEIETTFKWDGDHFRVDEVESVEGTTCSGL
ncbi:MULTISPECIES: hypothetical protein [unclassified Microbacterium]|uniref:hypothetical protein n=1 Tax=unclassified Microbacterium TaxID=2609290 RepID=UPI00069158B4|nr:MULTISPECIES: hypothetical protein [unclassified Microbacterium]